MPETEPIRNTPSTIAREGQKSRRNTAGSRASSHRRRALQLSHVHSFHLDDYSVYQDHHHDNSDDSDDSDENAVEEEDERYLEKGKATRQKTEGSEGAQESSDASSDTVRASGESVAGSMVEKQSRKSAGRTVPSLKKTQSTKSVRDPNLVTWDSPDDPENPKNWTKKQKWFATLVVSCFTFISPVSSSMVAPALGTMAKEFGISDQVESQLMLSVFVLAYAVGPLFLGPLSEMFGRVIVLQLANLFYLVFNTACGASKNAGMMIAFRFLSGLGGSAPLAVSTVPR